MNDLNPNPHDAAVAAVPAAGGGTIPLLYADLRKALACLYSLHGTTPDLLNAHHLAQQQQQQQQQEAHEFLMLIQSKNVKRKLQSLHQSQQDQLRKNGTTVPTTTKTTKTIIQPDREDYGSTWLACVALLCQADAHPAEKLFCAQTLLHRVRKYKLGEAMDIEMEDCQPYSTVGAMMTHYSTWMAQLFPNPFLSTLIQQYVAQHHHLYQSVSKEDDDQIRGEISMLVVTAIAYCAAASYKSQQQHQQQQQQQQQQHIGPLTATLGSALSAIALRIRFTPASVNNRQQQQQQQSTSNNNTTTAPLVSMVVQSLTAVVTQAAAIPHMYNQEGFYVCQCSCLAAIPDIILGGAGGARGKISIDPKCLHAASDELRHPSTGVHLLLQALLTPPLTPPPTTTTAAAATSLLQSNVNLHPYILETCEKWAKFLPLPFEFIEQTVPLAAHYIHVIKTNATGNNGAASMMMTAQNSAFAYLIAIFEGASWSVEHVLSFSLGLSSEQQRQTTQQQSGKKRQSSKSKKRNQEKLQQESNETRLANAKVECYHRGQVACRTTEIVWEALQTAAAHTLNKSVQEEEDASSLMDGEGPIGCICASANACLPHIVKHNAAPNDNNNNNNNSDDGNNNNNNNNNNNHYMMFSAISSLFQTICSSPHRVIRALTYEPLFSLHSAMIQKEISSSSSSSAGSAGQPLQALLVDHLYTCAMKLATSCGYPTDYFVHLDLDSDEELEAERNDVRDILRTLAGSEGATPKSRGNALQQPSVSSVQILQQIIQACAGAIHEETAVHAFSSVAKPLNYIGKVYGSGGSTPDSSIYQILLQTCQVLGDIHEMLLSSIPHKPLSETFALSRIAQLATASLSPLLSDICRQVTMSEQHNTANSDIPRLRHEFQRAVELSIHSAAISLIHHPELAAESTLAWRRYDIRGAMRGPGGEDHVGCLSLMRLAEESDHLTAFIVTPLRTGTSTGGLGPAILLEIGKLHDDLKLLENQRGPGIDHGKGVAPKSRRIVLGVISRFAIVASTGHGISQEDQQSVQAMLKEKFLSPVSAIASSKQITAVGGDAERMFRLCEATFDLASFSPELVSSLFASVEESADTDSTRIECMQMLVEGGLSGYSRLSTESSETEDQIIRQWGRLRGALVSLIRSSAHPGLPPLAVEAVVAWINAENHAIAIQCQAGPEAASSLFNESVIGEETLSAGALVRVMGEILKDLPKRAHRLGLDQTQMLESSRNSISVLQQSMSTVLQTILIDSPMASSNCSVDPRPTLCEAWFLTLFELIQFIRHDVGHPQMLCEDPILKQIVSESAAAGLMLLLFPSVNNKGKGAVDVGMSLDGPHMLAFMDFLGSSFALGPSMLQTIVSHLEKTFGMSGIPIIGAALFRGGSGGLPPWAVECMPSVFSALFGAFGKEPSVYGKMLGESMEIRLDANAARFGGVLPGTLFAGPLFKKLSVKTKEEFVQKSLELTVLDTGDAWRRFKVILKQLCGGKKKDSGFNLKPSYTNWECDRI